MKASLKCCISFLGAAFFAAQISLAANSSEVNKPVIQSIRVLQDEIEVVVQAPPGVYKVVLESRSRVLEGAWTPRAVKVLDGEGGELTFTLPAGSSVELLRVRAETVRTLPASFYQGDTQFNGEAYEGTQDQGAVLAPGAPEFDAGNRNADGGGSRDVVESDIWAIRGDTLYFFNQYRGLQVIDIADPADPAVRGTLEMPAVGEQMYVLDESHVILLARRACNFDGSTESAVLIVNTDQPAPTIVAELEVEGSIAESRLVGTALYVASQAYYQINDPADEASLWTHGSIVTSFDLASAANPLLRDVEKFNGYGNVIYATDQYLCVVVRNQWLDPSTLHLLDISNPNGNMSELASFRTAGYVADKFKMNVSDEILTVISEARGREFNDRSTVLENFSLDVPQKPDKVGEVQVGKGESLFATRFDGDKVYIVTFLRIDPLWIVDLSDPANPKVTGELEIPGWSTYIQPLGDRLVSIGIDNTEGWRVAVQLFDVADPENPSLLSKVPLGENHSWSEANSDEKALTVLPEAGLIMVPYQGFGENGYASQVQLIDLDLENDELVPRGVIQHQIQPRRATLDDGTIYSISGRELLSVDAADRDEPVVLADLALSWPVSQVETEGDYLIEVSTDDGWNSPARSRLQVVHQDDPGALLTTVELHEGFSLAGAHKQDQRLYVLESDSQNGYYYGIPEADDGQETEEEAPPQAILSVFDLSNLPELTLEGRITIEVETPVWGSNMKALQPKPGVLVWAGGNGSFYPWFDIGLRGVAADFRYPYYYGANNRLLAFDVSAPSNPVFLADTHIEGNGNWWNFGSVFTANGLVYLSHQSSEFVEDDTLNDDIEETPEPTEPRGEDGGVTDETNADGTNPDAKPEPVVVEPRKGYWIQRYYLDVVDYADPENPTLRKPANIPGELIGLSHQGEVLYTTGPHWDDEFRTNYQPWVDASAYDGVSASLIASLKLPESWPKPVEVIDGLVYVGVTSSDQSEPRIETHELSETGEFVARQSVSLNSPAYEFYAIDDLLLIKEQQDNEVFLITDGNELEWIASGNLPGCLWFNPDRANGSLEQGLWLPLDSYGIYHWDLSGQ